MRIMFAAGTRPEFVKLAPVIHELGERGHSTWTIATGQHYDADLADSFIASLGLEIDERWHLPASDSERTGALFANALAAIEAKPPDLVVVLGDTLTVPAFCFAARRHCVAVAHVEAGLRSFNPTSLEEVNRKIAAATATVHFAPTPLAAEFLQRDGVGTEAIRIVGNPVLDVLRQRRVGPDPLNTRQGVLFTAHRATNVDDPERLRTLAAIVSELAMRKPPLYFPVHPRTRARLEDAGLWAEVAGSGAIVTPPLSYEALLTRLASVRVVVTDSGGLQEEASWLGLPVVVMRRSTPRWESVDLKTSALCGLNVEKVVRQTLRFASDSEQRRVAAVACPYGDGYAARRIADALDEPAIQRLLAIEEPAGALPRLR